MKLAGLFCLMRPGLEEKEQIETGEVAGKNGCEIIRPAGKNQRAVFQSSVFVRALRGYIEKGEFKEIRIEDSLKRETLYLIWSDIMT